METIERLPFPDMKKFNVKQDIPDLFLKGIEYKYLIILNIARPNTLSKHIFALHCTK